MGPVTLLADHGLHSGNFEHVTRACISRLDPGFSGVTPFIADAFTLSCTCRGGFVYGTYPAMSSGGVFRLAVLLVESYGH